MRRRELGGDFPETRDPAPAQPGTRPGELFPGARLLGSGRAALLALLDHGRRTRGWRRLLLPDYVCREVPAALASTGVPFASYADSPDTRPGGLPERAEPGDVLLRLQYFGWRGPEERDVAAERFPSLDVIEDHTHDPAGPWARGSRAAYALASLRKTAPSADGAILWSPAGLDLPPEPAPTDAHLSAVELKEEGMRLKRQWLEGAPGERRRYTTLLAAGEARLGLGPPSGPHPRTRPGLLALDLLALGAARARGFAALVAADLPRAWLAGAPAVGGNPFGLVLDLGTRRRRDRAIRDLSRERVFAHVLWELDATASPRARAFSERTLVLACDRSSTPDDLAHAADALAALAARETRRERSVWGRALGSLGLT